MAKKKCPECPECLPEWLAAFGDLMSLLLCFFVLLLSMSSMDAKKVSEAIGSLSGAMSVLEGGTKTEISKRRIQESTPIQQQDETSEAVNRITQAVIDANEMMEKGHGPTISVEEAEEGFKIQLPASLLFKPGQAKIENEDALLFLKRVALIIQQLPKNLDIGIQGYTDNVPPGKNSPFVDNWELSAARAISVLKELIADGVDPHRMFAAGYGEYHPIATNATAKGREKNRRVEIHFYGRKSEQEGKVRKSVLDGAK
ncbi:Flagellar motor rotation protein MotB [hydrothermal vent metagenome]|uniref:Flagellar motor rotation protein MotB n=1 Tax=hydrothermal vent metagenome TaxID=652676 RepID=A0A1W1BP96_9ZZZZ